MQESEKISSQQPVNTSPKQPSGDSFSQIEEPIQEKKSNKWLTIGLIVLSLTTLGTAGFFGYRYFQLKQQSSEALPAQISKITTSSSPSPSPQPAINPTANWETYINEKYSFEYKCPKTSIHNVERTQGDGVKFPYFQEICYENQNQIGIAVNKITNSDWFKEEIQEKKWQGAQLTLVDFKETRISGQRAILYKTKNNSGQIEANIAEILSLQPEIKIFIRGFDEEYFDQVLSTFKFTD